MRKHAAALALVLLASTVLQAQQQLFPAEFNDAQYRAALFSALVDIYKALGGGWVAAAEVATR